jgi:hypothetical protein
MASTEEPEATNVVTGEGGPGTALKDLLPLPSDTQPVSDPGHTEKSRSLHDDATLSHALATEDHSDKGAAQQEHDEPEVADLGWHEKKQDIAEPLVGGLGNEDLWMLIRRFNKVSSNLRYWKPLLTRAAANVPCQVNHIPRARRA